MVGERWVAAGLLTAPRSALADAALDLVEKSLELATDAERELAALLSYPLSETLASEAAAPVLADGFAEVAAAVLAAADSGELEAAVAGGHDGFKASQPARQPCSQPASERAVACPGCGARAAMCRVLAPLCCPRPWPWP